MTYTFSKLLIDALSHVGELYTGTATGGSTTTIVDTTFRSPSETADQWKLGTAFVLYDAGGAGAAPEYEFATVTNYSSQTFTINALTAAVAVGDDYGVAGSLFTISMLRQLARKAMRSLPDIVQYDTSLTTAASQTEYTLPVGVGREIISVEIQKQSDDANDNRWTPLYNWEVDRTNIQGQAVLRFGEQPEEAFTLRIAYLAPHPELRVYSDVIDDAIHPKLATAALVKEIENYKSANRQHADSNARIAFDKASTEFDDAMMKYAVWQPHRKARSKTAGL